MKQPIKMTPGDELHLTALMAPFSLNLVTGQDRQHLLGYGRAAFEAGKAGQCLHQIQEPAAAEQAAWHAGLDEGRTQATGSVSNATSQAATTAVAVPDERAAFEAWAKSEDMSIGSDCDGYIHSNTATASLAWQARAALAATPAAAVSQFETYPDAEKALPQLEEGQRVDVGTSTPAAAPGKLGDDMQMRCRKCGEQVKIEFNSARIVTHNPHTGKPRDARDVESDPEGKLIVAPGPLFAAAAPVVLPEPVAVISELMGLVDEWGMESHLRGAAELDAQHSEATQEEIDCAKDRASKERAAWKAIESKLRALLATATGLPAQAEDIADLVTGMSVSVDVSTGDDDAVNRYFGTVTLAQEDNEGKHGLTLLVQDAEPNFTPQAQADARDARQFWGVIAPCGEGVFFSNEADARWTQTGEGTGSDGFGVPTIGEAFRESYEDEELELVRVHIAAIAAAKGEQQ